MRKEFELTEEQFNRILEASKPVPYIMAQCGEPSSPQENANRAWKTIAKELGFAWDSVEPLRSKGERFITAEVICLGIDLGDGNYSGCNQTGNDCPICGK